MKMTIDQIREKAPEGATHYDRDKDYLKFENNEWFCWVHWSWCKMNTPSIDAISRFKIKPL